VLTIMDVAASEETVSDYLLAHSSAQDEVLAELAEETRRTFPDVSGMQISADEGALLTMLVRLTGVRSAVEVGTFTGYSSICIARGLAEGGRLTCFEVSERYAEIARANLELAGVADRVDIVLGPAIENLGELDEIDFAYIDADKTGYPAYYDALLPRLRPGGLLVLDNTLRGGRVLDPDDDGSRVMAELNDRITADERADSVLLSLSDGVTIVRKRRSTGP
jgi:caffeoyl-CoA O-methyltransferase